MTVEKTTNFKEKTRRIFLKYAMIPVLVLLLVFPLFLLIAERTRVVNNASKASNQVGELISQVYGSYYTEIGRMSESEIVIDFVKENRNSHLVYEQFYSFNNAQKVKSIFHIIDKNGMFLASTAPFDSFTESLITEDVVPRIMRNPKETLTEANTLEYLHDRKTVYSFGRPILEDSEVIGFILYQLFEKDLRNLIFVQNVEVTVVTDNYDRIIAATSNIAKGLMNKFSPKYINSGQYVEINDGKYYMGEAFLSSIPIYVYTLVSTEFNTMVLALYGTFVGIAGLFLWFIMNHLATKISAENTSSIDKLLYAVYELQEGNLNSYVSINSGDEFDILANQYNIMLDKLNALIRKNEELSDIRRIKEIKLLQAHLNPHFLFNILETLRYTIILNQEQATDIIMTLSRLLRYSLHDESQDVVFKNDLAYIEDYLKLHKIRFQDGLTYNIDVSEEVKNALVPKLLLQAIIENSIKYGYKRTKHLDINVTGYVTDGKLVFEIRDNGGGMTEEQLNTIREMNELSQSELAESEDISQKIGGLYNVHRRLFLLYGKGHGLQIESTYGEGTLVTLTLPYRRGRDNVQGVDS
jgi:two-component system sensor histidine kinase YesM